MSLNPFNCLRRHLSKALHYNFSLHRLRIALIVYTKTVFSHETKPQRTKRIPRYTIFMRPHCQISLIAQYSNAQFTAIEVCIYVTKSIKRHTSALFTRNKLHSAYSVAAIKWSKSFKAGNHLTYVEVFTRRVQGNVPTPLQGIESGSLSFLNVQCEGLLPSLMC